MKRVFHFSGGRSSAMMLIENYQEGDIVIFCDTGREVEGTYKFINEVEKNEGIPIIRLKYEGGFRQLLLKRKAVPNISQRFCTIELKIKTARRYLRSIGIKDYIQFIGYRSDEPNRVKTRKKHWKTVEDVFPLFTQGVTKNDVLEYWNKKSYNLNIPSILGNCDACFLKGKAAIIAMYKEFPELADKWIEDEETIGHTYIKGISHRQMLEASKTITKQYDLFQLNTQFTCSCES